MGLLTIVFGLLAMWIAVGSGRWFVRATVGLVFVGLLVPIKAFQPIVFFSVSTAATVLFLGVAKLFVSESDVRRRRIRTLPPMRKRLEFWFGSLVGTTVAMFVISWAVREFWAFGFLESLLVFVLVAAGMLVTSLVFGERFRLGHVVVETGEAKRWLFQLSDVMLAVVLLSGLFAIDSYSLSQAPIRLLSEFFSIAGTLTLINVSTCMIVSSVRLGWRLLWIVLLLMTIASTFVIDFGAGNWLMQLSVLGPTRGAPWGKIVTLYALVLLCTTQTMWMSGWIGLGKSTTHYSNATVRLSRMISGVLAVVFAVCLLPIGFAMSRPIEQPDPIAGDPAVFNALADEASTVIELNPYGKRLDELVTQGFTDKADQIAQSNTLIRQLVHRPFHSPEWSEVSPGVDVVSKKLTAIRGWNKIALSEAQYAYSNGQFVKAADLSTDCLLFGSGLSRGGHVVHTLTGSGIEAGALESLVKLRKNLPSQRMANLLDDLIVVDHGRESTESLELRAHHNMASEMGWRYRLANAAPPHLSAEQSEDVRTLVTPALQATEDTIRRRDATHRLLIAEIAIELFRQRNRRLPQDLAELVPQFLPSIPIDAFTGTPLIYRIQGEGYVVYSTGIDGDDDGGNFGDLSTLYDEAFDFDVDTMFRPQRQAGFGGGGNM